MLEGQVAGGLAYLPCLKSSALETPLDVHKPLVESKAFKRNRKEALELAFTL
jgi:hypothetical protein